jgi:hypothetical protein
MQLRKALGSVGEHRGVGLHTLGIESRRLHRMAQIVFRVKGIRMEEGSDRHLRSHRKHNALADGLRMEKDVEKISYLYCDQAFASRERLFEETLAEKAWGHERMNRI